jgi:hypothetical protein
MPPSIEQPAPGTVPGFGMGLGSRLTRLTARLRRTADEIAEFWKRQPPDLFWPPHP